MVRVDDAILQTLYRSELWLSAPGLAVNTGYNKEYVRKACKRLESDELLESDESRGGPYYRITDKGKRYVEENN